MQRPYMISTSLEEKLQGAAYYHFWFGSKTPLLLKELASETLPERSHTTMLLREACFMKALDLAPETLRYTNNLQKHQQNHRKHY